MAIIDVPLVKVKGEFIQVDTDKVHANVWNGVALTGCKSFINRGTTGDKAKGMTREEFIALAEQKREDMYTGKARVFGVKKDAKKRDSKEVTEAVRIAKESVKQMIKANNEKISHYTAAEITAAAKVLVERDDSYLATARDNLARAAAAQERSTANKGGDIWAALGLTPNEEKVKKAAAKAAERKAETSATQAGKIAPQVMQRPGGVLRRPAAN